MRESYRGRRAVALVGAITLLLLTESCEGRRASFNAATPNATPKEKLLSVSEQREDLEDLKAVLLRVHPALVGGFSAEQRKGFDDIEAGISADASPEDFYIRAQSAAAILGDAHTGFSRPDSGRWLIWDIIPLGSGYCFGSDRGDFKTGDRITRVGGRKVEDLESLISPIISAENDGARRRRIAQLLGYESMLRRAGIEGEEIRVEAERDGHPVSASLSLAHPASGPREENWFYSLYPESSLAVLTLNTCDPSDDYRKLLASFFAAVDKEKIARIAVDLRRNGGGDSRAIDEFFRYLPIRSYRGFGGKVRVSADSIEQRGEGDGGLGMREYRPGKRIELDSALGPKFPGKLYVIVGPGTFSSANWFGVLVQDNDLGTVVGEPTGNKPDSYGDILSFALPNSGLRYTVSYKQWLRPDRRRAGDSALMPDIAIGGGVDDIKANRDPVLDYLEAHED